MKMFSCSLDRLTKVMKKHWVMKIDYNQFLEKLNQKNYKKISKFAN